MLLPSMGARAAGARLERMQDSPHWRDGRFANPIPREEPKVFGALRDTITSRSPHHIPSAPPPVVRPDLSRAPADGLRVTWLGHSSSLVEIDGRRFLLDPVFGRRASPVAFAGPLRFHEPPVAVASLPPLDAVLVSHDHYDHLDHGTIVALAATGVSFVVPLGVGAHLEHWGVPARRITELDWWASHEVGGVQITATPSRHFSGRSWRFADLFHTLWAGFALRGPRHAVYFSGDTAMFPGLREIGERLGPFDVVMMETGGYNRNWRDVHIGPEQAAVACQLVRGDLLLPVHWGTFSLSVHGWTEPVERVREAARRLGLAVAHPRPGESVEPGVAVPSDRWWPELPWLRAEELPVVSTRLDAGILELLGRVTVTA